MSRKAHYERDEHVELSAKATTTVGEVAVNDRSDPQPKPRKIPQHEAGDNDKGAPLWQSAKLSWGTKQPQ